MINRSSINSFFVFLLVSVPLFSWLRFSPDSNFISNSLAIIFAAAFSLNVRNKIHFQPLTLTFLAAALITLISSPINSLYFGETLTFLALILLSISTANASSSENRYPILYALTFGLITGALAQCFAGFFQIFENFDMWFVVGPQGEPSALMGNIGQRNNLGNYLALSLVSVCWLASKGEIHKLITVILLIIFSLFLSWTASRTVILYCLGLMFLSWLLFFLSGRQKDIGKMAGYMALGVLFIAVFQLCNDNINALLSATGLIIDQGSGVERFTDSGFGARRIIEWQKAWHIFTENPWFGVGYGSYAAHSVELEAVYGNEWVINALFTHSHNLVMQLLAEFGFVGASLILTGIAWAFLPWFKKKNISTDGLLVLSMAMIILLHSQLEYPLWYAPFLFIFAVLIGLSPTKKFSIQLRPLYRHIIRGFALLVLWQTVVGINNYMHWIGWVYPSGEPTEDKRRLEELLDDNINPLWTYETDLIISNYFPMTNEQLELKLPILERQAAYRPYAETLIKLAIIRAYDGNKEGALEAIDLALTSYPQTVEKLSYVIYTAEGKELIPLKEKLFSAGIHE